MVQTRRLRLLFYPIDAVGHVNACLGLGQAFQRRGHEVGFFIEQKWRGKIEAYGFTIFYYKDDSLIANSESDGKEQQNSTDTGKVWAEHLKKGGLIGTHGSDSYAIMKALKGMVESFFNIEKTVAIENHLTETIKAFKPEVFFVDGGFCSPQIVNSGKPFVKVISTNPTFFSDNIEGVPPAGSGLPTDGDRSEWPKFQKLVEECQIEPRLPKLMARLGYPNYEGDRMFPNNYTFAMIGYPRELLHPNQKIIPNWLNVESFMREDTEVKKFMIPASLDAAKDKYPGKLIFLSLGSMGSFDIDLMKRLVGILAETSHRYIVSKGPRHTEFELAENMWGDRFVPQTAILKVVDLVIDHGGNNTFTETILHGVPQIIMPLFGDQFDNAQRVVEAGVGARLDPYLFKDEDLPKAIDHLLSNKKIIQKMKDIAERINGYDRFDEACSRVEQAALKL